MRRLDAALLQPLPLLLCNCRQVQGRPKPAAAAKQTLQHMPLLPIQKQQVLLPSCRQ